MPDLNKNRVFIDHLIQEVGRENPLNAVELPLDAYSPCWCGSGKKWKFCHKQREATPRISFGELQNKTNSLRKQGPCLHPKASPDSCSTSKSIHSHTIQRRGGLASIAEEGHVYSAKRGFEQIGKSDGHVDMKKIGIVDASTFPGYCNFHDTETFLPVERVDAALNVWNGFLLSYRAVCYEYSAKYIQLQTYLFTRDFVDRGHPFEKQAQIQNYLHYHRQGIKQGLDEISALKTKYDNTLLNKAATDFSFYGVNLDRTVPFVASGAFMPEFDFSGKELQRLGPGIITSQIALNITQIGGKTCAVFGWFGGVDCAASRLVQSFKALPNDEKPNALLVLSMEYLENVYCKPSWWEGLQLEIKALLHDKIAGGLPQRHSKSLVEPGLRAIVCEVESELNS